MRVKRLFVSARTLASRRIASSRTDLLSITMTSCLYRVGSLAPLFECLDGDPGCIGKVTAHSKDGGDG
jgi:hypothetical protein